MAILLISRNYIVPDFFFPHWKDLNSTSVLQQFHEGDSFSKPDALDSFLELYLALVGTLQDHEVIELTIASMCWLQEGRDRALYTLYMF